MREGSKQLLKFRLLINSNGFIKETQRPLLIISAQNKNTRNPTCYSNIVEIATNLLECLQQRVTIENFLQAIVN